MAAPIGALVLVPVGRASDEEQLFKGRGRQDGGGSVTPRLSPITPPEGVRNERR
jgi:hypothetical protein